MLDRPDLIKQLRSHFGARPVVIESWNVTEHEVAIAEQLQAPMNGLDPALRHLGFKSAGRRLFAAAVVPVPYGREDVRTIDDVVAAIEAIRTARPRIASVVVKHDDSGAGDGNAVINVPEASNEPSDTDVIRRRVEVLPEWYVTDLRGGVVEELITGTDFASPSVQIDLLPDAEVVVLATHEQVLGGSDGQIYTGCVFPANPAYAAELARYGQAIGESLAANGVARRASVGFAAARDESGRRNLYALEVNLRKGGTTHPYAALRNLVPGSYDAAAGRWVAQDGNPRACRTTDNLVDESWIGMPAREVIDAVDAAGLGFDHRTGTGVVLHMLSGRGIDGRLGLTAFAHDPVTAEALYHSTCAVIARTAESTPRTTASVAGRRR
jgi:hypothetical protein